MFGLGAVAIPGHAAAQLLTAKGFTHDVASGEPRQQSVLLWPRYVPSRGDSAWVAWEVARTPDFARVIADGEEVASAENDLQRPLGESARCRLNSMKIPGVDMTATPPARASGHSPFRRD